MRAELSHYKKMFSEVGKREFSNLYLLHGSELFVMEEMEQRIVSSLVPKDLAAFNLTVAYGSEVDLEAFIASAASFPFLTDKRVLVLKELEKLRGSWKPLIEYCLDPVLSSVVILIYSSCDEWGEPVSQPRDFAKLADAVNKRGRVLAFEKLRSEDLNLWVRRKAKLLGFELTQEASEALIENVGENLFNLRNELEKLSLLFEGQKVEVSSLSAVIGAFRMNALAELMNSLAPGGEKRSVELLTRIVQTDAEKASVIISRMVRHFLSLLKIRAGLSTAERASARNVSKLAASFDLRESILWLENLREAEILLKSSSFPEDALLLGTLVHSFEGKCMEQQLEAA